MRQRLLSAAVSFSCFVAIPVLAQPGPDSIETMVAPFVTESAVGLPDFIAATAQSCYVATVRGLAEEDQAVLLAGADFIAGINDLARAKPELSEDLFPALDSCGGTIIAGELMWFWVLEDWADATVEEQTEVGSCLIVAVDRLGLDAKNGITRYRFGDFRDAIDSMLFERLDLAGTLIEDMAACGIAVEIPDARPVPG